MTQPLDAAKSVKARILQSKVKSFLQENHDWKVSKSVSTGVPLTATDINYRNSILAEYNQRVKLLNQATTFEQVNSISITF